MDWQTMLLDQLIFVSRKPAPTIVGCRKKMKVIMVINGIKSKDIQGELMCIGILPGCENKENNATVQSMA
jgi:hypothetical protein